MSEWPLVSVCIPSYNRADRLRRAVDRLLRCTYPNLEIIISDNASTDHTQEVCRELARANPHLRYFRQEENIGPTRNFEFARSQAAGRYFLWHADDDYLDADYIELCVRELEGDPLLVLVAGTGAYHGGESVVTFRGNVIQAVGRSGFARALRYAFLVEDNAMFYGVYRREAVADCHMPNCLGGDAVWLAEVLLRGRARILANTCIYWEMSDNASASPQRIAATLRIARWQGDYPWLALPFNLAREIDFSAPPGSRGPLGIAVCRTAIFMVSFSKQAIQVAMRRLPFGRALYKRLFASEMGI